MVKICKQLIVMFMILTLTVSTTVTIVDPQQLAAKFNNQPIPIHVSPIGFKPLSGQLEGKAVIANPSGACSIIDDVHNIQEDIFILADDSQCLESVKAKNIASSGGFVGLIKQNINNTLHDKEVDLVHIPIIQLKPQAYDLITDFLIQNPNSPVTISIDFTDKTQTHIANLQVWFSPTELESYKFIFEMKEFIDQQTEQVSFQPHYVLQSQRQVKMYIGCFSSGRYCPTQIEFENKYQGVNIVDETLRQLIIWKISSSFWWSYTQNFYKTCLVANPDIFMNSTQLNVCAEGAMIMAGIDIKQYHQQYNLSFVGRRREVDDNTYLNQERQKFIKQKINSHPIVLVNKKEIELQANLVQERVCKIEGDQQSGPCSQKHNLSTFQVMIILIVMMVVFIAIAALYRLYMHVTMRKQIKSEVDKTLEQYYRYIQTFEGQNGQVMTKKKPTKVQKSRPLTEQLDEVQDIRKVEIQMSEVDKK